MYVTSVLIKPRVTGSTHAVWPVTVTGKTINEDGWSKELILLSVFYIKQEINEHIGNHLLVPQSL